MIPTSFDYVRAGSLRDALGALAAGDGSKLIAGGHSLLPMMKLRLAAVPRLVDIAHLPELKGIAEHKRGARIGACTTYRELLGSKLLRETFPLLVEAVESVGDLQVRNRGTIGGSVVHADPASDLPAVMLALDARFNLRSKRGRRSVAAREFFKGAFATDLADDELVIEIVIPRLPPGAGTAYLSVLQAASGYAIAGAAAVVARKRKKVSHCALAFTGVSDRPFLVEAAGQLVGTNGAEADLAAVATQAVQGVDVNGDIHAPSDYRRHLAQVVARKALARALERAGP